MFLSTGCSLLSAEGFSCSLGVLYGSVADPGSLSRIPDPDFYPSRIPDLGCRFPDPKTAMKDRGEKKFVVIPFFGAINFTKLNYFIFENLKKKNLGQFSKNYRPFTQKIVSKLSKIWVWDPRSGIRKKPIPDPRSRGQKGTGSRIRNTACYVTRGPITAPV